MKTKHKAAVAAAALALALTGCMTANETAGTVLGGVAGGVVGNQFGKGSGKTAMTALGAVLGATVGRTIGASLDATSKRRAGEAAVTALDTARVGESISWENPGNAGGAAAGAATVTRQGADSEGRTWREFVQTVIIGGREEQSYGTACRDDAGDWQIVGSAGPA